MGVVLNVPLSFLTASFCATCRMWRRDFGGRCDHRGNPYMRTGRMMAWKARRQLAKSRPRTEFPRTLRACTVERAWAAMIRRWGRQSKLSVM